MEESKQDRRVQYTKMFLRDALIDIMKTKPIAKITPTELCRKANVNRNTFYAHYKSPSELLAEIEEELYNKLISCMPLQPESGLEMTELCRAIKSQADICKIILSENGDREFLLKLIASVRGISFENWKKVSPNLTDYEIKTYFDYCANGSVAIIYDWVNEGMKTSYHEIAEILKRTNSAVMKSILG